MRRGLGRAAALAMAAILVSGTGLADAPADPAAEACAKTACRTGGFDIMVFFDKDHYTSIKVTHSPYVMDGQIIIFPGETLAFELPLDGDTIGTPKFLGAYEPEYPMLRDPNAPPAPSSTLPKLDKTKLGPNTLVVSYGQSGGKGERDPMMLLMLSQNLAKTVKYNAIMTVIRPHVKEYAMQPTSTCPLVPKGFGSESWPQALGPMVLQNLRVLAPGAQMVCD